MELFVWLFALLPVKPMNGGSTSCSIPLGLCLESAQERRSIDQMVWTNMNRQIGKMGTKQKMRTDVFF